MPNKNNKNTFFPKYLELKQEYNNLNFWYQYSTLPNKKYIMKNKVLLVIRDGRGYRKDCTENSICQTPTPITDELMQKYPNILINASWESVWLPTGYQGNSEVWHMTIWSGRIIYQSLVRINKSIQEWSFFENEAFLWAIENCKKNNSDLHIIGLLQTQWVHAHLDHMLALLDLCKQQNFSDIKLHIITDWRDAPVTESLVHVQTLENKLSQIGFGEIATINGRFFAMDRDNRRERTQVTYENIVNWNSEVEFENVKQEIETCHKNEETDEFIKPRRKKWYTGIQNSDSVVFTNFRTDRTRQLSKAILEPDFDGFQRDQKDVYFVAMTQFYDWIPAKIAFTDISLANLLWEVTSNHGLKQLRISETEKYAHITFFFNWQIDAPFQNEDRILIPSPKVQTYDEAPEMSIFQIKDQLCDQLTNSDYDLIVTNLVNWDMVGHTWKTEAIHKAVSAVDTCVWEIVSTALDNDYVVLVFADHGNAEDQTSAFRTSHTTNPVPFILVSKENNFKLKSTGWLADVAPTTLDLLWIQKPSEMTGESLLEN